jgi:hypothetical protein
MTTKLNAEWPAILVIVLRLLSLTVLGVVADLIVKHP